MDDLADPATPPSGAQYRITHGDAEAHVSQVGATLRTYRVAGRAVIDGFPSHERASDGRGQILAPWPNRLTDGSYRYRDHDCQVPLNEVSRHGAIHGLVRWLDWSLVEHESASVTLSCAVRPQPGYEWQLGLEVGYALGPDGLAVMFRATNRGRERAPFGVGFHPYLTLGTPIDDLRLTVPAREYLSPGGPGSPPEVVATSGSDRLDLGRARTIGDTELDTAYSNLVRDADGLAVSRLEDPQDGRFVELWVSEEYRHLMVYTADRVGDPERRRAAVAVEPMTCPPDALRTGIDLVELEPGESWRGSWGMRTGQTSAS